MVKAPKIVFTKFVLPKKMISDAGMSFISETFRHFHRQMNIEQAITLSYHHQSNRQVKACIKFIECTNKNALILITICT